MKPQSVEPVIGQIGLFDVQAGQALREEALERVERAAPESFMDAAREALEQSCRVSATVTSDHVWNLLAARGIESPPEPRAMGAVFRRAQAAGLIAPLDSWVLSCRPACHRRPLRLWMVIR